MTVPAFWRLLHFAPESFGPELFALCRAVPALDHLLCRLDHIHDPTYPEDRVLRYYQRDLALHGGFVLRLPDTDLALRSGRSVMLPDKSVFFAVRGRPDLLLAAARVGFTLALCAVVLPAQRVVITLKGTRWNIDTTAAERALALFRAAGLDLAERDPPDDLERAAVTGDANYAHHLWNQLGALEALLCRRETLTLLATHQPIASLSEIFADRPGLTVRTIRPDDLPALDPRRILPFGVGGKVVLRSVRERILRVAERHASGTVRDFIACAQESSFVPIWLTVRVQGRTAANLFDALLALVESLLRRDGFAIVLDGFSRPNDYGSNRDYNRIGVEGTVAREQAFVHALLGEVANRAGASAGARIFNGVGCDLLDSIHLAAHCRAYFAHHGTLQHKIGYFTKVPGMAHANPGILATDQASGHRHVIEDPGIVEYIDPALVEDVVPKGGSRQDPNNSYRFRNIPALVATFHDFLTRQGVG